MANEQNLRTPDTNTAREMQKKSIKKRSENIKKRKLLRECLEELLKMVFETEDGTMSGSELAASALAKKAFAGDVKAFETLRDTVGEKPIENVQMKTDINIAESAERLSNIFEQIKEKK